VFSFISGNWRGQPLTDRRTIVELIGATTTQTGLVVHAAYDNTWCPKGVKITKTQQAQNPITRDDWYGEWNYTIAINPAARLAAHYCAARGGDPSPNRSASNLDNSSVDRTSGARCAERDHRPDAPRRSRRAARAGSTTPHPVRPTDTRARSRLPGQHHAFDH